MADRWRILSKEKEKGNDNLPLSSKPFTKSAVEIYNALNVKKPMELTIGLLLLHYELSDYRFLNNTN